MTLLVIGYPDVQSEDASWIESFRNEHDALYRGVVGAHFTIVFPTDALSAEQLVTHVHECVSGARPIEFVLRSALVVPDHFIDVSHVFLVPDEGNSAFIKLHDRLYRGSLTGELRLDIPYIPHLGIASNTRPAVCKPLADQLNDMDLAIAGRVSELAISAYDGSRVQTLATATLSGQ
jgi:2'-5' RNA ligase superfamily